MIYRIGQKGLEPMDVPDNDQRNNLPIGTVLELNGYTNPKFVIIKNLGTPEKCPGYGSRYVTVKLEDNSISRHDAYTIKNLADKKDNRIQMYYTDQVLNPDEVEGIWDDAQRKEKKHNDERKQAAVVSEEKTVLGRELFAKHIPKTAKALIVAEMEFDMSDMQTDYFATHTTRTVILGVSKYKRDIFSEMRKYADKIPETAHLKEPSKLNNNNEPKTEGNKHWWKPSDEHREKYSMGHGYYLKADSRYSTGWVIRKVCKYNDGWSEYLYRSLADQNVFAEPDSPWLKGAPEVSAPGESVFLAEDAKKETMDMNVKLTKEQIEYLQKLLCKTDFITDNPNIEAAMIGDIELQLQKTKTN